MTYPRRLIHESEEVLLDARPHWWQLVRPAVVALATAGGCAAIFVIWSGAPKWFNWVLLGLGAIGVCYFLARLVQWRSTDLVVTSMRVIYRRGVVSRSGREIPISSVQDVSYVQSLAERMIGKGQLSVQSAGVRDEQPFRDVRRPAAVQGLIDRTIEESRQRDTTHVAEAVQISVSDELEHLAALHRRGVITDREFARLKAELIGDSSERGRDGELGGMN
ncbi:MAG: PH domain-containing protein [Acidimicrobiales bacterium]